MSADAMRAAMSPMSSLGRGGGSVEAAASTSANSPLKVVRATYAMISFLPLKWL